MEHTYLESSYQEKIYNLVDITDGRLLTEDGHMFPIHKFFLARCSRYFHDIFCKTRKHEKDVLIPGIRGEVLSNILSYIYKGKVEVTEENICELMEGSRFLSLENLFSQMKTFLNKNLSIDNCVNVHLSAVKMNSTEIFKETYRFIETHFETLVYSTQEKFSELPLDIFKQLLNDRNLRVQNENVVWHAIVKWVESDLSNYLCRVPDLLMYLRITDVDDNLAADILRHAIVSENPFCQLINSVSTTNNRRVLELHQRFIWSDATQDLPLFKPRKPLRLNFIAYYCQFERVHNVKIYVTYDENIDLWRKIMGSYFCPNFLVCVNNYIYLFKTVNQCKSRYNIIDKEKVDLPDFGIPRKCYAAVELDRFLYILGGCSSVTRTDIYEVEIYDPEQNAWHNSVPMLPVICPCAVTLNGSIYVVGKKPTGYHMIAQIYTPSMNIWKELPEPSIYRRKKFTLSVYNEKIYLIGGRNEDIDGDINEDIGGQNEDEQGIRDVEIFNPLGNVWYSIESLPYAYRFPRAVVINDYLIVSEDPTQNYHLAENPPVQWNNDKCCWETIEQSSPLFNIHYYFFASIETEYLNVFCNENKMPTTVFEKSPLL